VTSTRISVATVESIAAAIEEDTAADKPDNERIREIEYFEEIVQEYNLIEELADRLNSCVGILMLFITLITILVFSVELKTFESNTHQSDAQLACGYIMVLLISISILAAQIAAKVSLDKSYL